MDEKESATRAFLFSFSKKFEIGSSRLRIKFCIGKLNLFLSRIWVWYPKKQPNLKKWFEILKKRPLCLIAAKLATAGTKLFALEHAPEL